MMTLVAGWFSFSNGHATAGDLLSRDLVCEWLQRAGLPYVVAVAEPFTAGIDWRTVDPETYSTVVFVCGPFAQGELEMAFLARFRHCRLIGLNLSMQVPLQSWNPFDLLIERDSSEGAHPDMVFGTTQPKVPVVGICLVEAYPEGLVADANAAIQRLIERREMAVVQIDTRLDTNSSGLRSPGEIESLIARVDALVTTRLHGTVLALKNGVPVVAIDPEAGGAKILLQAATIDWPVVFTVDALTDQALDDALDYCLTAEARTRARQCGVRAAQVVAGLGDDLVAILADPGELNARWQARLAVEPVQVDPTREENQPVVPREADTPRVWRVVQRVLQRVTKKVQTLMMSSAL